MAKRLEKETREQARSLPETAPDPFSMAQLELSWRMWLPRALFIIAAGLWIFSPAFTGGWIWDDEKYVSENSIIHDPAGFWKVWVNPDGQGDYYPLTSFVQWVQWSLWGNDTLGYHLTNVGLHLAGAFLIWRLFARLGLPLAWVGALLFTVHPLMIESVAWISELKNTLSLPLLLLAMLAWLNWKEGGPRRFYYGSLAWFIVAMLAKTSGMMLPVVLLGHAWWRYGKISRADLVSVAPFFAVAFVAGLVTLFPHHDPGDPQGLPLHWNLGAGLASVGWSIFFLLGKCILPVGLLPVYPGFISNTPTAIDLLPWAALGGLFFLLWRTRTGWGRHLLFGLGFFLVNLVPILGFILMKYSILVWSMDHNTYVSTIGLIGLAVAGLGYLEAHLRPPWRIGERALVVALVLLMAWSGHAHAGWYVSGEILWTRTLERDASLWPADIYIGHVFMKQSRFLEAIQHYKRVLATRPDDGDAHFNLGVVLEKSGQLSAAGDEYRQAIKLNPTDAKAYINLANLLLQAGDRTGAIAQYEQAVKFIPDSAQLRYDLGSAWLQSGRLPEAMDQLEAAVRLDPEMAPAHENLGSALAQSRRLSEAIGQFEAAIRIDDGYVIARNNLGLALAQTGHLPEAMDQFKQVLQIDPNNAQARESLAKLQQFEMRQPAPGSH